MIHRERGQSPLTNYPSTHNNRASSLSIIGLIEALIGLFPHLLCIFHTSLPGHRICTSWVDNYGTNSAIIPPLQHFSANGHRCGLKLVLCKYCSCSTWCLRGKESQVWCAFVCRLDSNVASWDKEAFGICATGWYILLLGCWYRTLRRRRVTADPAHWGWWSLEACECRCGQWSESHWRWQWGQITSEYPRMILFTPEVWWERW